MGQESGHDLAGFFIQGLLRGCDQGANRAVVSYEGAIRGRSTLKLTDLALGQFSST